MSLATALERQDSQELKRIRGKVVPGVGGDILLRPVCCLKQKYNRTSRPLMTKGHLSVKEGKQRGLVPYTSATQVVEEQKQINVEFFSSLS